MRSRTENDIGWYHQAQFFFSKIAVQFAKRNNGVNARIMLIYAKNDLRFLCTTNSVNRF